MASELEPAFSARDLIDDNAIEEGTYTIPLKGGKEVIVRKIVNFRTIVKLERQAANYLTVARKGVASPLWKPYLAQGPEPLSPVIAEMMAWFTTLIISPKLSEENVLELCAKNGVFAAWLQGRIKVANAQSVPRGESEEIEEAKNELMEASSGETTSPSGGTPSTENTPVDGTTTTGNTPATS